MSKENKELDEAELNKVSGANLTGGIVPPGEQEEGESDRKEASVLPERGQQVKLR